VELWARNVRSNLATSTGIVGVFLHAAKLRHGPTALHPSEGRHAEDFFSRKTRQLRSGLNSRTWVPEGSICWDNGTWVKKLEKLCSNPIHCYTHTLPFLVCCIIFYQCFHFFYRFTVACSSVIFLYFNARRALCSPFSYLIAVVRTVHCLSPKRTYQ
jgi:hypothetical protein